MNGAGPWGTGPYELVEGFSIPKKRSDRVILAANPNYWDKSRFPRLQRIIFDNTLEQNAAVKLVKTGEGRVDVVNALRPLDTLRVAQSSFGTVVKARGTLDSVFGMFNMLKTASVWRDVRLRQAVNYAINRADLIRYATKGNGVVIPALVPPKGFGYASDLAPYPFAPDKARQLLREIGHPTGVALTLIAPNTLAVQATVVSKMLEQVGFQVTQEILDPVAFNQQTVLSNLEEPPERQLWDIAIVSRGDRTNFPVYFFYHMHAMDGYRDWVLERPKLRQLYTEVLSTVDRKKQEELIRQMERHTSEQAYFLFLYNPIHLYAANKEVKFVPYVSGVLDFDETSVTDQHWSVRKQKAAVQK